ncbi:hypothetical protein LshimejAT787_0500330 [Lyophyllum shimeji]|uniref:Uncharacterized protein n=1 Tax=Lyophyllum shimeji TaxID=47721 RepID=A0A9P3UM00_LYOSH|nr:hypothetical protein LshimejAT787_0500330 [Lyophyllum shimeji]
MSHPRDSPCYSGTDSDILSALIVILLALLTSCAVWFTCHRLRRRREHKEWHPYHPWDLAPLYPCKDKEYFQDLINHPPGWGRERLKFLI